MNEKKLIDQFFSRDELTLKQIEEITNEINDECLNLYSEKLEKDIKLIKKKIENQKSELVQLRNLMISLAGFSLVLISLFWDIEVYNTFRISLKIGYSSYFGIVFICIIIIVIFSIREISKSPEIASSKFNFKDIFKIGELTLKNPRILKFVEYKDMAAQSSVLSIFMINRIKAFEQARRLSYILIVTLAILLVATFLLFGIGL